MAISKYTLYKYVKVDGTWRYGKAAFHDNGKIKPDVVFVDAKQGLLEKHPEGRYYMNHNRTVDRCRHGCARCAAETETAVVARRIQPTEWKRRRTSLSSFA